MKDCTTCKYGYEDERLGIPMCHHPKRFSEDCVDFNMHEEKESEHLADARKTSPKDLEEVAGEYAEEHGFRIPYDGSDNFYDDVDVKASKEGFIAGAKWQKEQDEKEQADLFTIVALDAAQRAKEQMMKEGLDAVKSGQSNKIEKTIAGVFVKYGMDRQKEQMMKEAIHYVVQDDLDSHGASYNIPFIRIGIAALKPKGIGVGDKVRIIIVKEDDV